MTGFVQPEDSELLPALAGELPADKVKVSHPTTNAVGFLRGVAVISLQFV